MRDRMIVIFALDRRVVVAFILNQADAIGVAVACNLLGTNISRDGRDSGL